MTTQATTITGRTQLNSMLPLHGTDVGLLGLLCVTFSALATETSVHGSLAQALRAWWVDPAVATLGFSLAISVYDRKERELGCTSRKFMSAGSVSTLFAALSLYKADPSLAEYCCLFVLTKSLI